MHMYHTEQMVVIGHQNRGNVFGLHQVQGFHRQHIRPDADATWRHHFPDGGALEIDAHIKDAAQVTIGKDTFNFHQVVDDHRQPQIFAGNLQQRIAQRGVP